MKIRTKRRLAAVGALFAFVIPVTLVGPGAAAAITCATSVPGESDSLVTPATTCCAIPDMYTTSKTAVGQLVLPGTTFKDGPGRTILVSQSFSGTITTTGSVTGTATLGGIVASAQVSVSASLSLSVAVTTTHTNSHNITANRYGHVRYQATAYVIKWTDKHTSPTCVVTTTSGSATIPLVEVGWYYWETTS
jgi:hypothetical protein